MPAITYTFENLGDMSSFFKELSDRASKRSQTEKTKREAHLLTREAYCYAECARIIAQSTIVKE